MRWRNELVLKMHWTSESGRDYGRGMMWFMTFGAVPPRRSKVMQSAVRRFAPEEFLTLHPWKGAAERRGRSGSTC